MLRGLPTPDWPELIRCSRDLVNYRYLPNGGRRDLGLKRLGVLLAWFLPKSGACYRALFLFIRFSLFVLPGFAEWLLAPVPRSEKLFACSSLLP